jgi:hypothetical protein
MRDFVRVIKFTLLIALAAPLLSLFGCGAGSNVSTPPLNTYGYVHVLQNNVASLAQFQVASDGTLKPLANTPISPGSFAAALAVSPDNKYL